MLIRTYAALTAAALAGLLWAGSCHAAAPGAVPTPSPNPAPTAPVGGR